MSDSKRNPFVDLVKTAVGFSSGSGCACGPAAGDKAAEPGPAPAQPPRSGDCGCNSPAAPAPVDKPR